MASFTAFSKVLFKHRQEKVHKYISSAPLACGSVGSAQKSDRSGDNYTSGKPQPTAGLCSAAAHPAPHNGLLAPTQGTQNYRATRNLIPFSNYPLVGKRGQKPPRCGFSNPAAAKTHLCPPAPPEVLYLSKKTANISSWDWSLIHFAV